MTVKQTPICEIVPESTSHDVLAISKLIYDQQALVLELKTSNAGTVELSFDSPHGVRVLDEGQLLEWKRFNKKNGWLWRVLDGGWLSLEQTRPEFWLRDVVAGNLNEYFIADERCVSVLSVQPPVFSRIPEPR